MHPILQKLAGTDRRSTGRANEVAQAILEAPELFEAVFSGMLGSEPVIRMRAADAVEKASRQRPELLQPYKERLLHGVAAVNQQEVRWHPDGLPLHPPQQIVRQPDNGSGTTGGLR